MLAFSHWTRPNAFRSSVAMAGVVLHRHVCSTCKPASHLSLQHNISTTSMLLVKDCDGRTMASNTEGPRVLGLEPLTGAESLMKRVPKCFLARICRCLSNSLQRSKSLQAAFLWGQLNRCNEPITAQRHLEALELP